MTASVQVDGHVIAAVDSGKWTAESEGFADYCTLTFQLEHAFGYNPDPYFSAARLFAEKMGGEVVGHIPVEYVPGRVY